MQGAEKDDEMKNFSFILTPFKEDKLDIHNNYPTD